MPWPKSSENMTKKYFNFEKLHQKQFFQQGGAKTFAGVPDKGCVAKNISNKVGK